MNLQELQTLVTYNLPVTVFVYNNAGYLSIKTTQRAFFDGRFVGSEAGSGVRLPSLEKLAAAYGLPYFKLASNQELDNTLPRIFATPGPTLVEVMLDPFEVLGPKAASWKRPDGTMVSAPLEDKGAGECDPALQEPHYQIGQDSFGRSQHFSRVQLGHQHYHPQQLGHCPCSQHEQRGPSYATTAPKL